MRIGAPVVSHSDGFATPDQLCAASPEVLPATDRQFAGLTVKRPVPPFHRKNTKTIAHAHRTDFERLGQWRRGRRRQLAVEAERDAGGLQMTLEGLGCAQRRDSWVARLRLAHAGRSPAAAASVE